jgi:hypothetical protein
MHSIDTEDLTICYSGTGLAAAQLCLIAALTEVGSCHIPNLPTSHVPKLTFYVPNLAGASNAHNIEQCHKNPQLNKIEPIF